MIDAPWDDIWKNSADGLHPNAKGMQKDMK